MCCDRILTGAEKITAMDLAIKESSVNRPPPHKPSRRRFGASSMGAPLKMALEAGKKWADGRTLGICFLATLYPAWRASRLKAVDGIRYIN